MTGTYNPQCPHCLKEFDDEETWFSGGAVGVEDGDETNLSCSNCEKDFRVVCFMETKFQAIED